MLHVSPAARAAGSSEVQTYITSINRLYETLEYERALEQISSARRVAKGVEDDVILSLYEGIILADMRKLEASNTAFKSALLLKPDAELPILVSPKVTQRFERVRKEVKHELAAQAKRESARSPVSPEPTAEVSTNPSLRSRAFIPAIAGGVLLVAGGVSYGLAQSERTRLRKGPEEFASFEEAQRAASHGRTLQTLGFSLATAGVVGLGIATGMYALGAPSKSLAFGVGMDGRSAFVSGRWP